MALSQEKAYVKFCEAEENGRHFGQKKCSILILDNLLYFLTLCYFTLIFLLDFHNQLWKFRNINDAYLMGIEYGDTRVLTILVSFKIDK